MRAGFLLGRGGGKLWRLWKLWRRFRLFSEACRWEEALAKIGAALATDLKEEAMIKSVASLMGEPLPHLGVFLAIKEGNGEGNGYLRLYPVEIKSLFCRWLWRWVILPFLGGWEGKRVGLDDGDNILTMVFREKKMMVTSRLDLILKGVRSEANRWMMRLGERGFCPARRVVILPLVYQEEVLGVLGVFLYRGRLDHQTREFLRGAARLVAMAIGNSRLYQKAIRDREEIQMRLARIQRLHLQAVRFEGEALVGKMAGTVAHDLNNPLAAILGFAQIIRRESTDPQLLQDLETVEACVLRCRRITDAMLDFSRLSREEKGRVSLNLVVSHVLDLVRNHLQLADIHVEMKFAQSDCTVLAYRRQVEQVILSILNYIERKMPEVREVLIETVRAGETVQVRFRNPQGLFPPDLLSQALQAAVIEKDGREAERESDLGIACLIAREHGGELRVDQASEGPMLVLELPLARGEREA